MIQGIPRALEATLERSPEEAKRIVSEVGTPDAVLFTGSGTAFHTALLGSQLLRLTKPPVRHATLEAFELLHYLPNLPSRSLVVGVSHSGITKATVDAVARTREEGASSVAITHFSGRPIARVTDHVMIAGDGPDLSKCHTKCYLAGAVASTALVLELLRT
ncbi:MAG: SIS domain-containing protein, partial [Thermoplasmata archaeon]|nr:SIS domain-containing protein [Thermoplasmata archaeon]